MLSDLLHPTQYHVRMRVWKKNPYHDEGGYFTTKEKAHTWARGPAQQLLDRHPKLASPEAILERVVPDARERARYLEAEKEADRLHDSGESTKRAHTKPGTKSYTNERLKLHRDIIAKLVSDIESKRPAAGTPPTVMMIGGRSGSGKTSFGHTESAEALGLYDHQKNVVLDPDVIKGMLPGYNPRLASVYHDESTDIFDKAVAYARKLGVNTVLDFTMSTSKRGLAHQFKNKGYRVEAHYMHRPPELAAEEAVKRYLNPSKVTRLDGSVQEYPHGRVVPMQVVLKQTDNEKHFDALRSLTDAWTLWDNSEARFNPKLVDSGDKRHLAKKANPYHDLFGRFTSKLKSKGKKAQKKLKNLIEGVEKWTPDKAQEGRMLNGVPLKTDASPDFSQSVNRSVAEPPLKVPPGKKVSAGVVVTEPDGRVWVVQPKNQFGGYKNTFPKGTVKPGEDLQETAAREVWEESGLVVKITGHLTDVERTTSVARFYRGERVGGAPWAFGHETHAVKLLPIHGKQTEKTLENVISQPTSDRKVLEALRTKRAFDCTWVLKHNPYRDEEGKYTDKAHAVAPGWYKSHGGHHVEVGPGEVIASGTHQGKPAVGKHFAVGPFKTHAEAKAFVMTDESATAKFHGGPVSPYKSILDIPPESPALEAFVADTPSISGPYKSMGQTIAEDLATQGKSKQHIVETLLAQGIPLTGAGFLADDALAKAAPPFVGKSVAELFPNKPAVATQEVAKNMAIANPNEYVGKKELEVAQNYVVAQLKPSVGHAKVMGQEVTVNPKTGLVEVSYYHQFYDKAKAQQAQVLLNELYAAKMGEGGIVSTLKGSRIYVKSIHDPKAASHPPVMSEKALQPPPPVVPAFKPTSPAQTAAKQKQLDKAIATYEDQYVERVIRSLDLKFAGQNSKAKSTLAPLTTIEKSMVTHGITPTDMKALQEKLQKIVDQKADENFQNALAKQVNYVRLKLEHPNDHYSGPAYSANIAASQAKNLHPGLLKQKGGAHAVTAHANIIVNMEKFAVMQELANAKGQEAVDVATKKAIKLGLSDAVTAFQFSHHPDDAEIRETLKKPIKTFSTVAEAEEQMTDVAVAHYTLEDEYVPYGTPDAKVKEINSKKAVAKVKYDLARAAYMQSGGTVAGLSKLVSEFKTKAQQIKYAQQAAKAAAKDNAQLNLKAAAYEVHKTLYEQGPNHEDYLDAVKNLDVAMTEGVQLLGQYDSKMYADQGKVQWDAKIKDLKGYATEKVTKAVYAYEHAVLNGAPAETLAELKLQMDHVKTTESKFFPSSEMDEIVQAQTQLVMLQKASLERLAKLNVNLKARLESYDARATEFDYPDNGTSKFQKLMDHQVAIRNKLPQATKSYLSSYAGSAFTPVNKAAGKFGSDDVLPNSDLRSRMEMVDHAMTKLTLGSDLKLNRTMAQVYVARALGVGDRLSTLSDAQLQNLVGQVYTEGAFSSTSRSPTWGNTFSNAADTYGRLNLKIRAGADTHGIVFHDLTGNNSEKEVLLARGTTYVVRAVRRVGNSNRIEMDVDVVGQLPKPLPGALVHGPVMGG